MVLKITNNATTIVPLAVESTDTSLVVATGTGALFPILGASDFFFATLSSTAGGMEIIAGAPNIVRGGSHSGNIAAADLVRAGRVDAFASDYVPAALVESAWLCVEQTGITLPQAVGYITDKPARMSRLPDRGRIEPGLRADLVHVRVHEGHPVVMQVWRGGERVA